MFEDCTPPSSPYRCLPHSQEDYNNRGIYRPFDCFSRISTDKNLDIHDECYLRKENSYLDPVSSLNDGELGFVSDFFLYKSLDDLAAWSPIEELFRICRMKLMMASSWQEPQLEVRQNVLSDLVTLRSCVDRAAVDSSNETNEFILAYFNQLSSLRLLLGYLPDIPDCMLSYMWTPSASAFPEAWYNLFHLHLDLRWYHLTCVYQLVRARCDRTRRYPVLASSRHIDERFLEEQLILLASELLELAIRRFEKTTLQDLPHTSPYCCKCIEEMWLMLQLLIETMQLCISVQPFESIIRMLLDAVQPTQRKCRVIRRICSTVSAPDTFQCSNPTGFCLWFLFHLSQLSGYSKDGLYLGPSCGRVKSNYEQLNSILRSCLGTEGSVTEEQLQVYLLLVKPLIAEWWELSTEPIMLMWEYFHCRLNSAFYVRGAPPQSIAVMCSSGSALLSQVHTILDTPSSSANSFVLFLHLLGVHLQRGIHENNRRAWQQLKGRMYSKFAPSKMAGFSELGLYHFASLFLVLAINTEMKQVVGRCQEFLGGLLKSELDNGRRAVIWKANLAFLLLHLERGIDITEVAQPFMSEVGLNTGNSMLMKMFIGDLQLILSSHLDSWGSCSHSVLFDGWLVSYLNGAPPGDVLPLLDGVVRVMTRAGAEGAWLGACVLQFVKRQFSGRGVALPPQVFQLAVELTMLSARHSRLVPDSSAELFRYFGCSLVVDARASLGYLCLLLQRSSTAEMLASRVSGYTTLLVQSWIRILLVCQSSEDLSKLTRFVASLQEVRKLCQMAGVRLESADDAFQAFVEAVGGAYVIASSEQDKTALRERCSSYFGQIEKYVEPLLREPPSYQAVKRVYGCAHHLIRNCKTMLYQRNSPNNILLSLVAQLFPLQQCERELHPHRLTAVMHHLLPLLKELQSLVSSIDTCVGRTVRQLVVKYLPIFDGHLGLSEHPLVQFFAKGNVCEIGRLILQAICDEILRNQGVLHKDANIALAYILHLTKQHRTDVCVLRLIAEVCLQRVFEIAMFTSETGRQQSQVACEVLSDFLTSPALEESRELKETVCAVLLRLYSDKLAFSMVPLFKLLSLVTTFQPRLVAQTLPQLWVEVRRVESRRGVARDPALRTAMEKIDQAIKLITGHRVEQ